ncbi:nuclear receptor co-repressor 1 [Terramyces sp. JEL0728]|nr:nuclear receptor co-repressor 1 [Terramyces sp. JEL0728]
MQNSQFNRRPNPPEYLRPDPQRDFRKRTQSQDNRPLFRNDFRREEGQRFPPDGTPKPYKRFPPSLIDSDRFRTGRNEQFDEDISHQRYRADIISPEQKDARFSRERFQNSPNMGRPFDRDPRYMEQDWQRNRDVRNDRWMNRERPRFEREREPPYMRREDSFHHQYQRPYFYIHDRYQREPQTAPREYRPGMQQREFFQNRPRSPQRWPPEQSFERRDLPYQRLYQAPHPPSNGPSLMASMGVQKRRRSIPGLTPNRFSMNGDDSKMDVDGKEDRQVSPIAQKASLLAAKKETPRDFSASDSSESDDMYDQEYIEEQIDRIDNEIAKQERMLTNVRTKIAAAKEKSGGNASESVIEDVSEKIKKLPEFIMEEFRPKFIQHKSKDPVSTESLIADIYSANRKLNRTFRIKSVERATALYNLAEPTNHTFPSYDPAIFETATKVDVKLRSAIVRFLRNQKLDYIAEQDELQDQFASYKETWLKKVKKLENKKEKSSGTPIAAAVNLPNTEDSVQSASGTRSTRRTGFRSDVVRSEEEWQNALSFLGIVPDESKLPIAERCAKDVPMITDPEIRRQISFHNTNNLVQDPERDLAAFNSLMDYRWSDNDRNVFKTNLVKYGKDFYKIAGCLEQKSTHDCVQYYYREKINLRFKNLLRRSSMPGRGRRRKEKAEAEEAPSMFRTYRLHEDEEVVRLQRKYDNDDDGEESEEELYHKPHAVEVEPAATPISPNMGDDAEKTNAQLSLWTEDEKTRAMRGFDLFGKDFAAVSSMLGSKTAAQCKFFYNSSRKQQGDEEAPKKKGPGRKPGAKPRKRSESGQLEEKKPDQNEEEGAAADEENENEVSNQQPEKKRKIKEPGEKKAKRVKKSIGEEGEVLEDGVVQPENATETARRTVSYWSVSERSEFLKALAQYGRNWETIAKVLQSKSAIQVRNYFHNSRKKLKLDDVLNEAGHGQDEKLPAETPTAEKDEEEVVEVGIVKQPNTPMAHSRKLVESLVAKLPQISEIVKQTEYHPPATMSASVKNLISSPKSALLDPYRRMSLPALAQEVVLQQNLDPGQNANPNWSSYVKSRSPSFDVTEAESNPVKHEFIVESQVEGNNDGHVADRSKGESYRTHELQQHKFIMENPKEGRRGSILKSKDFLESSGRTPPNVTPIQQREFIIENPVAAQGKRKSIVAKSPDDPKKYLAEFQIEKPEEQKHKPIILKFKMGLPQNDQPTKVKSVEKVEEKPRISLQSFIKKQTPDVAEGLNDRERTPPVIQTPALKQYGGLSEKIVRSNSIHISSPVLKRVDPVVNETSPRMRGNQSLTIDDLLLPKLKVQSSDGHDHLKPISSIYNPVHLPSISNELSKDRITLNTLLSRSRHNSPDLGIRKSNSFDHTLISRADIDPVQALMELSHGAVKDPKSDNTTKVSAGKSHSTSHVGSRISSLIDVVDSIESAPVIPTAQEHRAMPIDSQVFTQTAVSINITQTNITTPVQITPSNITNSPVKEVNTLQIKTHVEDHTAEMDVDEPESIDALEEQGNKSVSKAGSPKLDVSVPASPVKEALSPVKDKVPSNQSNGASNTVKESPEKETADDKPKSPEKVIVRTSVPIKLVRPSSTMIPKVDEPTSDNTSNPVKSPGKRESPIKSPIRLSSPGKPSSPIKAAASPAVSSPVATSPAKNLVQTETAALPAENPTNLIQSISPLESTKVSDSAASISPSNHTGDDANPDDDRSTEPANVEVTDPSQDY